MRELIARVVAGLIVSAVAVIIAGLLWSYLIDLIVADWL